MDKLLGSVRKFVYQFSDEFTVEYGDEFCLVHSDNEFLITTATHEVDFYFISNLYRQGGKNLPLLHAFTWSILHELGHIMTLDKMEDDTLARIVLSVDKASVRDTFEVYCLMTNEAMANDWAIGYVLSNVKKIKTLDARWTNLLKGE